MQTSIGSRARSLLLKADSEPIDVIAEKLGLNLISVLINFKKYKNGAKMLFLTLLVVVGMLFDTEVKLIIPVEADYVYHFL